MRPHPHLAEIQAAVHGAEVADSFVIVPFRLSLTSLSVLSCFYNIHNYRNYSTLYFNYSIE